MVATDIGHSRQLRGARHNCARQHATRSVRSMELRSVCSRSGSVANLPPTWIVGRRYKYVPVAALWDSRNKDRLHRPTRADRLESFGGIP